MHDPINDIMDFSPAATVASERDIDEMTDEELDKYFASCAPLSNLPTPPPAKEVIPTETSTLRKSETLEAQVPPRATGLEG